ncbi:Aste57867_5958 [Aphanomyces stellatus]|uniref:Aste57867_5958 protein n=1 Tax=Aphanomyces stellatus TaxID=120398 RepID=A0A485KH03_9STRA|nr:hypothetical protein As57867_005944 [Aphanomyces stellatus]VFT82975.1 Aste57867_5958 [Aphanomyces stellatus]
MHVSVEIDPQPLSALPLREQEKLIKASWLVEDAFHGVARDHPPPTLHAARLYKLYHQLQRPRRLGILLLLLVSYLETPFWCHGSWPTPCGDPSDPMTPLTSGMLSLTPRNAYIIELVCLTMSLLNDAVLYAGMRRAYFSLHDRVFLTTCVLVEFVIATLHYVGGWTICAQIAPFLRLAIFMATYRDIRKTYTKMYKVLAEVQNILALVAIYICFFASLGTILFQGTDEAAIMPSFLDAVWQLLILLTTANFPDVMMPAYATNRLYSVFFIVFVTFGIFFLINLVLAQIFSNFQSISTAQAATADAARRALLQQAFQVLVGVQHAIKKQSIAHRSPATVLAICNSTEAVDTDHDDTADTDHVAWIEIELAVLLFEELNYLNVTSTNMTHRDLLELFQRLDSDSTGRLGLANFLDICDAMGNFNKSYKKPLSEVERWLPSVARQQWYMRLCMFVEHKRFDGFVDTTLAANGVAVVIEMALASGNTESSDSWAAVHTGFSCIYLVEMLLKVLVFGIRDYLHLFRNRFDAVITIICSAVDVYAYIPNSFSDHTFVKMLLMVRCLRLLRILLAIGRYDKFRVILATGWAMLPIGKSLLLAMACTMNVFALIGLQLFGGLISPGGVATDPLFVNSSYAAAGYAANNFNDIPSAMVTLFELLVVNNWYEIVDGHVRVTSVWARLFFVTFWLVGVYLTLSLIVASILDAFSREYMAAVEALAKATDRPSTTATQPPKDTHVIQVAPDTPRDNVQ